MKYSTFLLLLQGSSGPANSVPASISATSTIGTTNTGTPGTWSGAPVLTYQWQRLVAAVWTDIVGATTLNRAPVDADFGYSLRVLEIPNGVTGSAVASNATNLTQEAPVEVLTELMANSDFASSSGWSAGLGWSIGGGLGSHVSGSSASIFRSPTPTKLYHESTFDVALTNGGWCRPFAGNAGSTGTLRTTTGTFREILRFAGSSICGITCESVFTGSIDNVFDKEFTLNGQLTAPSANMKITQYYTLPVSPVLGDQIWLPVRISGNQETDGNYGLILLYYTGSQWNLTAHIVTVHSRAAAIITANNVGSTNGLQITLNNNSWTLESTANNGSSWDARGSATNATYNTATGVNVMATSGFTLGNMEYAPA